MVRMMRWHILVLVACAFVGVTVQVGTGGSWQDVWTLRLFDGLVVKVERMFGTDQCEPGVGSKRVVEWPGYMCLRLSSDEVMFVGCASWRPFR